MMEPTNEIYYIFDSIPINNDLINIENMEKFMIPPHQKQCIKNIIKASTSNDNPYSVVNIDLKYLYNF